MPAAFAGWKPALPGFARPEAVPAVSIITEVRPIGNWNWQLATFPHWQHLPHLHLRLEENAERKAQAAGDGRPRGMAAPHEAE